MEEETLSFRQSFVRCGRIECCYTDPPGRFLGRRLTDASTIVGCHTLQRVGGDKKKPFKQRPSATCNIRIPSRRR